MLFVIALSFPSSVLLTTTAASWMVLVASLLPMMGGVEDWHWRRTRSNSIRNNIKTPVLRGGQLIKQSSPENWPKLRWPRVRELEWLRPFSTHSPETMIVYRCSCPNDLVNCSPRSLATTDKVLLGRVLNIKWILIREHNTKVQGRWIVIRWECFGVDSALLWVAD